METRQRKNKAEANSGKSGFELGYKAEKILGATDEPEIQFLIKWKNRDVPEMVSGREANVKCPQLVIAYYEARLQFEN